MAALRPIAGQHLLDEKKKKRVWSEELLAWGAFSSDPSDFDEFLIWCSVSPGDRIQVQDENEKMIHTVVKISREMSDNKHVWSFKLINPYGSVSTLKISESDIFRKAWGAI